MATLGFLGDLLGLNNGDPTIDAANKNRTAITDYGTKATGIVNQGASQAGGYLGQAKDLYSPLADLGTKASTTYADALGLNGDAGNTAATAAFHEAPGYQYNQDQQIQALERTAAARGGLGGGGLGADIMDRVSGNANQGWNSWLSQLSNPGSLIAGGVAGESNALGNLANLSTNTAGTNAGIAGDVVNGTLGANNQQASGETANASGLSNLFGNVVGGVTSLATGGMSNLGSLGKLIPGMGAGGSKMVTNIGGSGSGYGGFMGGR